MIRRGIAQAAKQYFQTPLRLPQNVLIERQKFSNFRSLIHKFQ